MILSVEFIQSICGCELLTLAFHSNEEHDHTTFLYLSNECFCRCWKSLKPIQDASMLHVTYQAWEKYAQFMLSILLVRLPLLRYLKIPASTTAARLNNCWFYYPRYFPYKCWFMLLLCFEPVRIIKQLFFILSRLHIITWFHKRFYRSPISNWFISRNNSTTD